MHSPRLFVASLGSVMTFALALAAGCGDSSSSGGGGAGGGADGGGGSGGGSTTQGCPDVDTSDCDVVVAPSDDDTSTVQTALIEAESGSTVCLCPGTYALENELQVTTPNLTVRGAGETRDDVVLDFAGQIGGDDGLTATADGFTVENLSVKNSPGNGVVATGVEGVTFRNLKVFWDAGSATSNGAYAVYPVGSSKVLIEDCEIVGAADAGAYVGQSTQIIVRNNLVHANVAGIEIENSNDAEVYGNESYDNAAGILVFTLPNLDKKDGLRANVHDNDIHDNNRDNFAEEGTIVAAVPPGIGVLVLAADNTEIHGNTISGNKTGAIVTVSFDTLKLLIGATEPDPDTDPDPENTYVHDNTFDNNGTDPSSPLDMMGVVPIEDFLWDGVEKTDGSGELCLSASPPTFRNINGFANLATPANHDTDPTPYECEGTPLEPIQF